jgi:hypothetical protein
MINMATAAVQVYGKNRGSTTAKGRWLARGVETLMWQYPGLRVAYMDTNSGEASWWGVVTAC